MSEYGGSGALSEAWGALHGGPLPDELRVEGTTGHFRSRLPVENTAIACVGAALLTAIAPGARSARLATGQVAAAVRSEAHVRRPGGDAPASFAPLSRFWPAADGWVRTHANYPWHRAALLWALGEPADLAATIERLPALELERRVVEAGGVAAAVRTRREWLATPQGKAAADLPLVDGYRIAEGAPRCREPGALPASGVRVLDLTRVIAGPVCTRYLAALGADVLRIDPPHKPEPPRNHDAMLGKRSSTLDLRARAGRERLHELLDSADVLVHGYRPGALDRFGLDTRTVAEIHPGLVVVSLSAWGRSGPWSGRRGFDSIVQAASGVAMIESPDGEKPGALPCQLLDHGTGYLCAGAVLDGLRGQSEQGGTHVRELSLARTAQWLLDQPEEDVETTPHRYDVGESLVTVDRPDGPITVVRPPGEVDGIPLAWPEPRSGAWSPRC
ncbi:CoA transferase [Parasphingorhabdus pacifica]